MLIGSWCHRVLPGEVHHVGERHLAEPVAVHDHLELRRIGVDDLLELLIVAPRVPDDLVVREPRARLRALGGVPDHARVVADDHDDPVTEILELPELPEPDGVPEMEIGGAGIEALLHDEGTPLVARARELRLELLLLDDLDDPALQGLELLLRSHLRFLPEALMRQAKRTRLSGVPRDAGEAAMHSTYQPASADARKKGLARASRGRAPASRATP